MKLFSRCYRSKASVSAEKGEPDHPPSSSRRQLQRGGAKKVSSDSSAARWMPRLEAIMEEGVGARALEKKDKKSTGKKSNGIRSKPQRINPHYDGYFSRNSSMRMAMPTFTPTPCMF